MRPFTLDEEYYICSDGMWIDIGLSDETRKLLPLASDRFREAWVFGFHATIVRADVDQNEMVTPTEVVNWMVSAHLSAYIGISEAAEKDYERAKKLRAFKTPESPLYQERNLTLRDDPLAGSTLYRVIRNLRVHNAYAPVEASNKVTTTDLALKRSEDPLLRWYFKKLNSQVVYESLGRAKDAGMSRSEYEILLKVLPRFNEFLTERTMGSIIGRMLSIMSSLLEEQTLHLQRFARSIP